ncbi:MAG: hypothetical protein WC758_04295 [Candidatus Woesearchaeota archaeon]|jgi:hypothetical protein
MEKSNFKERAYSTIRQYAAPVLISLGVGVTIAGYIGFNKGVESEQSKHKGDFVGFSFAEYPMASGKEGMYVNIEGTFRGNSFYVNSAEDFYVNRFSIEDKCKLELEKDSLFRKKDQTIQWQIANSEATKKLTQLLESNIHINSKELYNKDRWKVEVDLDSWPFYAKISPLNLTPK